MTLKPGVKTTELYVIVLTELGALAAALAGELAPRWAAIATAVSAAAYALARGWAKSQPVAVPVVTAPPQRVPTDPTAHAVVPQPPSA